jgi:hypothetical protein
MAGSQAERRLRRAAPRRGVGGSGWGFRGGGVGGVRRGSCRSGRGRRCPSSPRLSEIAILKQDFAFGSAAWHGPGGQCEYSQIRQKGGSRRCPIPAERTYSPEAGVSPRRACAARSGFRRGPQPANVKYCFSPRDAPPVAAPSGFLIALRVPDEERPPPDPTHTTTPKTPARPTDPSPRSGPPEAPFRLKPGHERTSGAAAKCFIRLTRAEDDGEKGARHAREAGRDGWIHLEIVVLFCQDGL